MSDDLPDGEGNRLGRRLKRYAQVGAGMGGMRRKWQASVSSASRPTMTRRRVS